MENRLICWLIGGGGVLAAVLNFNVEEYIVSILLSILAILFLTQAMFGRT